MDFKLKSRISKSLSKKDSITRLNCKVQFRLLKNEFCKEKSPTICIIFSNKYSMTINEIVEKIKEYSKLL